VQGFLKFLCLALVCAFTLGADSCSSGDETGPTFVTDLTLKDVSGVVSQSFARGEPITMELSVRNRLRTPTVLQFSSGYQSDFIVVGPGGSSFPANQVRWRWSFNRSFVQSLTEVEFAAEETKIITVTWDQRDNAGLQVSSGNYEARGVMVFSEFPFDPLAPHQLGSPLRAFTIR